MIIAEIGLNHRGSYELAEQYVTSLLATDVDAITFQIREPEFYVGNFQNFKLSLDEYHKLRIKIKQSGKLFGIAISDASFMFHIDVDIVKILSKDLEDLSFIEKITDFITNESVFLSTGMSDFNTINTTLNFCKNKGVRNIKLIHTRLSNSVKDVNLKAIETMRSRFGDIIAFGNHCENPAVIYTSIAYNPTDYYFYVKHNEEVDHPDDLHAVYLEDVQKYCKNISDLKFTIGSGLKNNTNNIIEEQ